VKYGTNSYRICAGESYWCTFLEVFDYFLSLKRSGLSEISMQQLVAVFTKVVLVPYLCGDPIPYFDQNFNSVVHNQNFNQNIDGSGYFDLLEFIYGPLRDHEISPLILQSLTDRICTLFDDTSKIPRGFRYEHLLYLPYEFFCNDMKSFHDITKYVANRFITEKEHNYSGRVQNIYRYCSSEMGNRLSNFLSDNPDNRSHIRLILEDIWLKNTLNYSSDYCLTLDDTWLNYPHKYTKESIDCLVEIYKELIFLHNHKWGYLVQSINREELFFFVFHDMMMMNDIEPTSILSQVAIGADEIFDLEALRQVLFRIQ
jgi:hypothetical protein